MAIVFGDDGDGWCLERNITKQREKERMWLKVKDGTVLLFYYVFTIYTNYPALEEFSSFCVVEKVEHVFASVHARQN